MAKADPSKASDLVGYAAPMCLILGIWATCEAAIQYGDYSPTSTGHRLCNIRDDLRDWWLANALVGLMGFVVGVPVYMAFHQLREGTDVPFSCLADVHDPKIKMRIKVIIGFIFWSLVFLLMVVFFIYGHVLLYRDYEDGYDVTEVRVAEIDLGNATKGSIPVQASAEYIPAFDKDGATTWRSEDLKAMVPFTSETVPEWYRIQFDGEGHGAHDPTSWAFDVNDGGQWLRVTTYSPLSSEPIAIDDNRYTEWVPFNCSGDPSCSSRSFRFGALSVGAESTCGKLFTHGKIYLFVQVGLYIVAILIITTPYCCH